MNAKRHIHQPHQDNQGLHESLAQSSQDGATAAINSSYGIDKRKPLDTAEHPVQDEIATEYVRMNHEY